MMKQENKGMYLSPKQLEIENRANSRIIEIIIDGLSIIEDRHNRLTGNFTSRWPIKQKLIDETMGSKQNIELARQRGESYIKY